MKVYHSRVSDYLGSQGLTCWIMEGEEELIGGRVFVRYGGQLFEDRDAWHETRTAAMDEMAVRIESIAHGLVAQAKTIRAECADIRRAVS